MVTCGRGMLSCADSCRMGKRTGSLRQGRIRFENKVNGVYTKKREVNNGSFAVDSGKIEINQTSNLNQERAWLVVRWYQK